MAADRGKDFLLKIEDSPGSATFTTIANLTTLSSAVNNSIIDITNKDSDCFRELLEGGSTKSVDVTIAGILTETTQQDLLFTNATTNDIYNYQVVHGESDSTITAAFQITAFTISGGFDDAQTFDATLISSGTITYA